MQVCPLCKGCWSCPKQHNRLSAVFQKPCKGAHSKTSGLPSNSGQLRASSCHVPHTISKGFSKHIMLLCLKRAGGVQSSAIWTSSHQGHGKKTPSLSPGILVNTQVEKWFLALPLPGLYEYMCVPIHTSKFLTTQTWGEKKQKEKLHSSTTMLMYLQKNSAFLILSFQSSNIPKLGWEQNFGGNTEELQWCFHP